MGEFIQAIVYVNNIIYRHELRTFKLLNFNKLDIVFLPYTYSTKTFYERNGDRCW